MKIGPFWIIGRRRKALFGSHDLLGFVTAEFLVLRRVRQKALWLSAGGPIASLVEGLSFRLMANHIPEYLSGSARAAGAVSLWLAVLSLWP
jgi:hypothetical protein